MTDERKYPRIELGPALNVVEFDVIPERWNQLKKWGPQSHPDGTGHAIFVAMAGAARERTDTSGIENRLTWEHILTEEFYEALAESEPDKLRAELVQVAAVAVAWIEDIDWRQLARNREAEALKELQAEVEIPDRASAIYEALEVV